MNILFLTMVKIRDLNSGSILLDLFHELEKEGVNVYIVSPIEKKERLYIKEGEITEGRLHLLNVNIGNYFDTNKITRGLTLLDINRKYKKAIKRYYSDIKFDCILYSTPPIMFSGVIKHIKRYNRAKSILLLKDIFPQNAVDLGMMKKTGIMGLVYKYFRYQEKKLYNNSDYIGCMSPANVSYLLRENSYINAEKVGIIPNCISVNEYIITDFEKKQTRKKNGIPDNRVVFVYGGNLGKPQGIDFLMQCLYSVREDQRIFFLIIGDGTEYTKLKNYITDEAFTNVLLMDRLKKEEYEKLVASCDVGMLFLDHKFEIPNFPSRLLGYLKYKLPVFAATDPNTDVGKIAKDEGFGWWIESDNVQDFKLTIEKILKCNIEQMGETGFNYLKMNYNAELWAKKIIEIIS